MNVKMMMRIDVIERETGVVKKFELGADFAFDLLAYARPKKDVYSGHRYVRRKLAIESDEIGNLLGWQRRLAINQHQMKSDTKSRQTLSAGDGIGGRRRRDHKACRRQDTVAMRLLHGLVHRRHQAKIVGSHDQLFQEVAMIMSISVGQRHRLVADALGSRNHTADAPWLAKVPQRQP
jgi:hypothetical protein